DRVPRRRERAAARGRVARGRRGDRTRGARAPTFRGVGLVQLAAREPLAADRTALHGGVPRTRVYAAADARGPQVMARRPSHWLVKSEPGTYSWDDLVRDRTTRWDGVRNAQARNNLQAMQVGDLALFYHSGEGKEVVGVSKVVKAAYPDPTTNDERWVV